MAFRQNVGSRDRLIRIGVGAALLVYVVTDLIAAWGWLGSYPLLTGMFRFDPIYTAMGVSTFGD